MKEKIEDIVKEALKKTFNIEEEKVDINIPSNSINGNYSTPVSLILAKVLKKSPLLIANSIKDSIEDDIFTKIEIKEPGFINFFVKKDYLFENMYKVLSMKEAYGSSLYGQGKKINLEYVSANPTGTLHLGHARGAAYGDSLARILKFTGYDVTREYYVNDAGSQMLILAESIKARYLEANNIEVVFPENGYHAKEIITLGESLFHEYQDTLLNEDLSYFKNVGLNFLIEQIKKDLMSFRVEFDVFISETMLYEHGLVTDALEKLKDNNYTYLQDGALFLKTTLFGDSKDRVLVKSDGNYTYFVPDIAYHKNKC
ncbi:MAG: arginine--tRNA ligase, partial [Bacilli bacterium]